MHTNFGAQEFPSAFVISYHIAKQSVLVPVIEIIPEIVLFIIVRRGDWSGTGPVVIFGHYYILVFVFGQ